jgi:hypothetical protein
MKYTILVIVLVLALLATGLAFAQGAPRDNAARAKQHFTMKQRILRAKASYQQKQRTLQPGFFTKRRAARTTHMMKLMRLRGRQSYDPYSYRVQAGGNRGKQGVIGKQMPEQCPMRNKLRQHAEEHPAPPQGQ